MKVFFISDLHLGHKKICEFSSQYRGNCQTVEEHDSWLINQWNSVVSKQDLVWVLGDVAFSKEGLAKVKLLNGTKHLILGNHDQFTYEEYRQYFQKIHGFMKYKGHWLSHAPVHPNQLRGFRNIHGHVHHNTLPDSSYINVSVEALEGKPIVLDLILAKCLEDKRDE